MFAKVISGLKKISKKGAKNTHDTKEMRDKRQEMIGL